MVFRLMILMWLLAACKSGEMACPDVEVVKLRKRPKDYGLRSHDQSLTASKKESKVRYFRDQHKQVKTAQSIEEWDCPRPGGPTQLPRAVRKNIRKNQKKFDEFYKNKQRPDTLFLVSGENR